MSFLSKVELKKQLSEIGIKVEGNYVRKKDVKFLIEAAWIKGDKLSPETKKEVLNSYIYRWTKENHKRAEMLHKQAGSVPTIPLITDEEWLASHAFSVNKDGSLSKNVKHTKPEYMIE